METTLWSLVAILFAGAVTPGANNFVVLHQSARAGWRRAVPAMVGVLTGGTALLVLISAGVGALLIAEPRLAQFLTIVGCLYLGFLGWRMMAPPDSGNEEPDRPVPQAGTWSLFTFQFLNPKSWLLLMTVSLTAQDRLGPMTALPVLVALFVAISAACLGLWSWLGASFHRSKINSSACRNLDRLFGLLLMGCALALLAPIWR